MVSAPFNKSPYDPPRSWAYTNLNGAYILREIQDTLDKEHRINAILDVFWREPKPIKYPPIIHK